MAGPSSRGHGVVGMHRQSFVGGGVSRKIIVQLLTTLALASGDHALAQQPSIYRVGVILSGGPYNASVDGLREGLRELGFAENKQYVFVIRDLKGDRTKEEDEARNLERDTDLIFAIPTNVATAAKRATTKVPIVFAVGSDPVAAGLVESFPKPGGRVTGVHYLAGELTAKRLELLKAMLPEMRRAVTFYTPTNPIGVAGVKAARVAAKQLNIEILERPVASVEELRKGILALKPREADAYFHSNDSVITSAAQFIIDTARIKKLPTMFAEQGLAAQGALAGYGTSYYEVGRLSASYVHRILTGTNPRDLPVEAFDRIGLAVNLKTAREIGVALPQAILLRADKVIQ